MDYCLQRMSTDEGADRRDMPAIRKCQADAYYETSAYKTVHQRYDVVMAPKEIGGVYTEVFKPTRGVSRKNKEHVLINLHGGGFRFGSVVTVTWSPYRLRRSDQIKVISIDYRMAPEYTFPAATEDVVAVYRELIKTHNRRI